MFNDTLTIPMHDDYYQNTLYPLQDKVLEIVGKLPVGFYLTGGTDLSLAYLNHRYSDDLDFFVNNVADFKSQVNIIIKVLADAVIQSIFQLPETGTQIILTDITWKQLMIRHVQSTKELMDIQSLSDGLYLLKITSDENDTVKS